MRRTLISILCAVMAFGSAAALSACGSTSKTESSSSSSSVPKTTEKAEFNMANLFSVQYADADFAGYWKISDGKGSQLDSFVFEYDGKETAYMLAGTMGYFAKYSIKSEGGKNYFTTQMFGLDGTYSYTISGDKKTITLTDTSDNSTSTLTKIDSYNSIPKTDGTEKIDDALLGAWQDDTGEILYFDKSGVMLDLQKNISFTFYRCSAEKGNLTQTYLIKSETTDTATYSVKGDTLTYNNYDYKRISENDIM